MVDGLSAEMARQVSAIGDGQVPIVAAVAFRELCRRAGIDEGQLSWISG